MSYFSNRALRWAAPVALVGALGLAACGNGDDTEPIRVAAPSVAGVGSDQHLTNKAEELARASAGVGSDQHLNNMAADVAVERANRAWSARLTGQAEQIQRAEAARVAVQAEQFERSAHLDGQANTYGTDVPTNSDANLPNAFEAGNRAAQAAQAEAYVDQLEDRADTNHSILPGWHHVPSQ
jgi:hypothetical protein